MLCPSCHHDFPEPPIDAARSIQCPWCAAVFADLRLPAAAPDRAGGGIPPPGAIQKPRPFVTAVQPRQPDTSATPGAVQQDDAEVRLPATLRVGLLLFVVLLAAGWVYQSVGLPKGMLQRQSLGLGLIYCTLVGAQAFLISAVVSARQSRWNDDRSLGITLVMTASAILLAGPLLVIISALCGYPLMGLTYRTWPMPASSNDEPKIHWVYLGLLVFLFFGTQLAFLLGVPNWGLPAQQRGRPVWVSLLAGTFVLAVLGCGLYWVYTEVRGLYLDRNDSKSDQPPFDLTTWIVVLVGWGFWLIVFTLLCRGPWPQTFRRLYRTVVAGTALELLVTVPVDVVVRKRAGCYCTTGTYCALTVGMFVAIWCFGPGLVLLLLIRARQRRRLRGHCRACGLDIRQAPGPHCPDCGTAIHRSAG
jgi:hypothetical protein